MATKPTFTAKKVVKGTPSKRTVKPHSRAWWAQRRKSEVARERVRVAAKKKK